MFDMNYFQQTEPKKEVENIFKKGNNNQSDMPIQDQNSKIILKEYVIDTI